MPTALKSILAFILTDLAIVHCLGGPQSFRYAETPDAIYRGTKHETVQYGVEYVAFRGIRYAYARRFRASQIIQNGGMRIDAIKDGSPCPQLIDGAVVGNEDCLFLNIYTPSLAGNFPVMVYIHGGGWQSGTIEMDKYSPDFFMDTMRVVVVAMQYRLGPFGFIDLSNGRYPTNLGLLDQRRGIEWIRKNILFFGGDPERVTLIGNSAGAASVQLHLIESYRNQGELSTRRGSISGGICQSGSILAPWATMSKSEAKSILVDLISAAKCPKMSPNATRPPDQAIKCLKRLTSHQIINITSQIQEAWWLSPFRPVVGEHPLLEHPIKAPYTHLPLISGINSYEIDLTLFESKLGWMSLFVDWMLPEVLMYKSTCQSPSRVTQMIKNFYKWNQGRLLDFFTRVGSDCHFVFPNYENHKYHRGPSWNYFFDVREYKEGEKRSNGSKHADEMKYFFPNSTLNVRENSEHEGVSISLVDLWINFAEKGSPVSEGFDWPEYSSSGKVLFIKNEGLSVEKDPATQVLPFWNGLPFRDKIINK